MTISSGLCQKPDRSGFEFGIAVTASTSLIFSDVSVTIRAGYMVHRPNGAGWMAPINPGVFLSGTIT
jgi:hypothetical protein